MKTKLTPAQLELMIKVRDRMYADFFESDRYMERYYICHNIVQIENGLEQFDEENDFCKLADKKDFLSKELLNIIGKCIDHKISFEIYLEELDETLKWADIVTRYGQMGRLAWLDRIVETGEIA